MPLSKTYVGPLSDSFAFMGRLCFSMVLANDIDSGSVNEFMLMLKDRVVEVTVKEVSAHV